MKDEFYFRQLDQQYANEPCGKVVLTGSVEAWLCTCFHWNGMAVPTCNNCGQPKPYEPTDEEIQSMATTTLARVETAISRAFKAAGMGTPDELHYFNALLIVILARMDEEEHVAAGETGVIED